MCENYTGKTDSNGECTITGVPEGTYNVTASKNGYVDYTGTITVPGEGEDSSLEIVLEESDTINVPIKVLIMTDEGRRKLAGVYDEVTEETVPVFDSSEVIEYIPNVTVTVTGTYTYGYDDEDVFTSLDSTVSCTTGNAGGCTLRGLPKLQLSQRISAYLLSIEHETYTTDDLIDNSQFEEQGPVYGYISFDEGFCSTGMDDNGNYLILITPPDEGGEHSSR